MRLSFGGISVEMLAILLGANSVGDRMVLMLWFLVAEVAWPKLLATSRSKLLNRV